jgi:hypothetical protein
MFHAYVQIFDVTKKLKKFCKILGTKYAPRGRDILPLAPTLLFESIEERNLKQRN